MKLLEIMLCDHQVPLAINYVDDNMKTYVRHPLPTRSSWQFKSEKSDKKEENPKTYSKTSYIVEYEID